LKIRPCNRKITQKTANDRKPDIFQSLQEIMMEVIVTNEFRRMNSGSERRPFKVLTPPERSSKMVIARYSNRPRQSKPSGNNASLPQDMLWKAIRVGSLCAACAFAFFSFSQRNWFQRAGDSLGPLPDSVQRLHFIAPTQPPAGAPAAASADSSDAKIVTPFVAPQTFALPQSPNLTVTEFNLSVNPEFQSVANVDVRLSSVNASANTYDVTIRTPYREFYRQDVKLAEHIPLSRNQTEDGPELVVGAISQNRVYGYVSESRYRGHRRRRRHQQ
jgi:hypothetical protein